MRDSQRGWYYPCRGYGDRAQNPTTDGRIVVTVSLIDTIIFIIVVLIVAAILGTTVHPLLWLIALFCLVPLARHRW